MLKRVLLFVIVSIHGFKCIAQFQRDYIPKSTYSERDKVLINKVQDQLENELQTINSNQVQKIFKSNSQYLITQIKERAFLDDDTLQTYVQEVFTKLLIKNNISAANKTILVYKNPDINALCLGEGSFFVTVGLLRKIESEGQLAFTLAHELAHYELGHVKSKISHAVESKEKKKVDKIVRSTPTIEKLEELKDLFYVKNRYSRVAELQADSLGFTFYKNANYNQLEALELIDQLNFSNYSKSSLGAKLFLPFHFRKFPFKEAWLKSRLGVYNRAPQKTFIFNSDSIRSHPDFIERKEKLKSYVDPAKSHNPNVNTETIRTVVKTAELEAIESAFFAHKYDIALFLALELKAKYPGNDFINLKILKILINLYEAHENRALDFFVSPFTSNYSEDLRLVNNFLHNAKKSDLSEIAFNFLNQKSHFNPENQEHYFLLWKISGLSRRFSFQEKILNTYLEKFPEGDYRPTMK